MAKYAHIAIALPLASILVLPLPRYAHIAEEEIPLAECLKDTVERCLPYWKSDITPALQRGKTVLVAAHGNSIRGILKYLDDISDEEVAALAAPSPWYP